MSLYVCDRLRTCVTYLDDFVTVLMKCVAVLAISSMFMELGVLCAPCYKGRK